MTLDELLLELRENILHDRSDRVAGSPDQLWSDVTLVRYIDQAQRRFARHSLIIRDGATASCTQVTLQTGVTAYALHAAVLAVISAKLSSDSADLVRAGHSHFNHYRPPDLPYFDPSQFTTLPPGKPLAFSTDEYLSNDAAGSSGRVTLRIYPAPSATYNNQIIQLRVCRLPIARLALQNKYVVPELPEDYHLDMLDWAAYLALRNVDQDAEDPARAAQFRASFEVCVREARKDAMRRMFSPMGWGFGRNGFSWEGN